MKNNYDNGEGQDNSSKYNISGGILGMLGGRDSDDAHGHGSGSDVRPNPDHHDEIIKPGDKRIYFQNDLVTVLLPEGDTPSFLVRPWKEQRNRMDTVRLACEAVFTTMDHLGAKRWLNADLPWFSSSNTIPGIPAGLAAMFGRDEEDTYEEMFCDEVGNPQESESLYRAISVLYKILCHTGLRDGELERSEGVLRAMTIMTEMATRAYNHNAYKIPSFCESPWFATRRMNAKAISVVRDQTTSKPGFIGSATIPLMSYLEDSVAFTVNVILSDEEPECDCKSCKARARFDAIPDKVEETHKMVKTLNEAIVMTNVGLIELVAKLGNRGLL